MNKRLRKMIAPIIIVVLIIGYYVGISFTLHNLSASFLLRILVLVPSIILSTVLIFVLYIRIKEIRSGEEDDLSKY